MTDNRGKWRRYEGGMPCADNDYVDVCVNNKHVYNDGPAYQAFSPDVTHWRLSVDDTPERKARRISLGEDVLDRAAAAILKDIRGRRLLKWLFAENADTSRIAIGHVDGPIDLTTQRECVDTWSRLAIAALTSPTQTVSADKDAGEVSLRSAWLAGRDAALAEAATMARTSRHLVSPIFVPAIEGLSATMEPPALSQPLAVDTGQSGDVACAMCNVWRATAASEAERGNELAEQLRAATPAPSVSPAQENDDGR